MTNIYRLLGDEISGENKQFIFDYFDALNIEESLSNLKNKEMSKNRFEKIELKNLDEILVTAQKYLGIDQINQEIFSVSNRIGKTGSGINELVNLMKKIKRITGNEFDPLETGDDEHSQKIAKLNNLLNSCRKLFSEEKI